MAIPHFGENESSHSVDGLQRQCPTFPSESGTLGCVPNLQQDCHCRGERCKF
jgi:hypothetical protein